MKYHLNKDVLRLKDQIEKILSKSAKKTKTLQFAMNLPVFDLSYSYSSTTLNQRFHSASVGKMMTATLVFKAIEQGKLTLDSRVKSILTPGILDKLFLYDNHDFQEEITIRDLLGHISGLNDYFESKSFDGSLFTDDLTRNPNKFWKPADLLDYTRNRQKAIARRGISSFIQIPDISYLDWLLKLYLQCLFIELLKSIFFHPVICRIQNYAFTVKNSILRHWLHYTLTASMFT